MKYLLLTILFCICRVYTDISDYEDEKMFFHRKMRVKHANKLPPCNEDELMMDLAEIQVINPENIINLSTVHDLKVSCNQVKKSLSKIEKYLTSCEPPQQKDLYMQLIRGVHTLHSKLCEGGYFKTRFEKYFSCYRLLSNDYRDCLGPADWNEDNNNAKVCRAYQDIADCYYVKTAKLCGNEAADTLRELILAVINSILTINCDIRQTPPVSTAMPGHAGNSTQVACSAANYNFLIIYIEKLSIVGIILQLYCTLFYDV